MTPTNIGAIMVAMDDGNLSLAKHHLLQHLLEETRKTHEIAELKSLLNTAKKHIIDLLDPVALDTPRSHFDFIEKIQAKLEENT